MASKSSALQHESSLLIQAVKNSDCRLLKELIRAGADVNCISDGCNALCVAAQEGFTEIASLLLSAPCNPTQLDKKDPLWHRQAIHHAAAKGHLAIVQMLVQHGVSVNVMDKENRTPLHWAATSGWVPIGEYLVANGAAVNIVQNDGFTALHAATCLGHLEMCQFLLSVGAEINRTDRDGWSALHTATCYGHPEVVQLFLSSGAKVNQKTRDEETALHIAVEPGNLTVMDQLIDSGAEVDERTISGFTPFFESVWRNKYGICKYLIDMGSDVNVKNNAGHSALYIATVRAAQDFMYLLVMSGCNLQAESWIRSGHFPVALKEHKPLCEWLQVCARRPRSLQTLCCLAIRAELHQRISLKAEQLPIPQRLQQLVALRFL